MIVSNTFKHSTASISIVLALSCLSTSRSIAGAQPLAAARGDWANSQRVDMSNLFVGVRSALEHHRTMFVTLTTGERLHGRITAVDQDGFTLRSEVGLSRHVAYQSVATASSEKQRKVTIVIVVAVAATIAFFWLHSQCFYAC